MFSKKTAVFGAATLLLALPGCNRAGPTTELTLGAIGDFASRRICVPTEHIAHVISLISPTASVHAVGRYQLIEKPPGNQVAFRAVSRKEYLDPKARDMFGLSMRIGNLAYADRLIRTVPAREKTDLQGTALVEQYIRGDGRRYSQDQRVYRGTDIATGQPGSFQVKCNVRNDPRLPTTVRKWCDVSVQVDEGLIADFFLRQPWLNRVPQIADRVTQLVRSYQQACPT